MQKSSKLLAAISSSDIVVWFPCECCDHPLDSHDRPTPDAAGQTACSAASAIHRDGHVGPCDCLAFVGALPDGTPKGLKLRQLTPLEWIKIGQGRGVPVAIGEGPDEVDKQQAVQQYGWLRAIVQHAVLAVRIWDDGQARATWQPVKVKASDEPVDNENWELSIDQLDRAGLVAALAQAVIRDVNSGGPFCGYIRKGHAADAAPRAVDDGIDGRAGGHAAARGGDLPAPGTGGTVGHPLVGA